MNGFKPTNEEIRRLDRLARKYENQLQFARHSSREHRGIPFVEERPRDQHDVLWSLLGVAALAVGCFFVLALQ